VTYCEDVCEKHSRLTVPSRALLARTEENLTNTDQKKKKCEVTTGKISRAGLDDFFDFEEVEQDGKVGFAIFRGDTCDQDGLSPESVYNEEFEGGYQFVPKPKDQVPWLLPSFPSEYVNDQGLFNNVEAFIHDYLDLPFEWQYPLLASWILAQWRQQEWESVPYLNFIGPKSSGKTRANEVLLSLSYRGLFTTSMSAATLFHAIEKDSVTCFFDEAEFLVDSKEKIELLSIINNGYRRGGKVFRYNMDKADYEFFNVFGFKAFASTKILAETLESRSIIVYMQRNSRVIPIKIDQKKAAWLRGQLLLYRFRHLNPNGTFLNPHDTRLSDTSEASEPTDALSEESSILEKLSRDNRLIELYTPLVKVTENMPEQQQVIEAFKKHAETRQTEESLTIEARIIEAIAEAKKTFLESGKIHVKDVTDVFNQGRSESEAWRSDSIGRQLKKLGFESCRMPDSKRGIILNEGLFLKYQQRFLGGALALQSASVGSEASEASTPTSCKLVEHAKLEDLKIVEWGDTFFGWHTCCICGSYKQTNWKVETFDQRKLPLCEDCKVEWEKHQGIGLVQERVRSE